MSDIDYPKPELRERIVFLLRRMAHFLFNLPPLLLLPLIIVLFFNKMALSNLILARGDTFLYFYPYWEAAADALQNGRVPLWNPQLFMGAPFLANSQAGFFYPLNWPLWLLLPTPYAVNATILLHLFIGGWGAYLAAQRTLYLDRSAALATAVFFALSGYVTAQVEHINQLQGMAWLPWFFVVLAYAADEKVYSKMLIIGRTAFGLATLFTLQLLSGHTQTTFISGVGVLVWSLGMFVADWLNDDTENALLFRFQLDRFKAHMPLALLISLGLAGMITAVQLLPTLELAQLSSRQGGLLPNEVMSFSLHPLLLTKALLPGYGQLLFSEYVAFLPITALVLAVIGAWQWRQWRGVLPAVALIVVGLLLALGQFNPLYWGLARLPGFNLFRVPARWMVLYTFGVALLAGLGWQIVLDRWLLRTLDWRTVPERARENLWHVERPLRAAVFIIIGLMAWSVIANFLAFFIPTGPESPYEAPTLEMILLWGGELLLLYGLLGAQRIRFQPNGQRKIGLVPALPVSPWPLAFIGLLALFVTTRTHSYNHLTTPEAYFDLRPTTTRLQAANGCDRPNGCPLLQDRFLSMSDIFFDPGDQAEIDTIYQDQLPISAQRDYTVAIKQKEIIAPNLPLAFGLTSVDGFDGGVLPLRLYSQMMTVILPDGATTTDGRLREHLTQIPAAQWLDLFNVKYIISDKTGDVWRDGAGEADYAIFFDRQHELLVPSGQMATVGFVPDFAATAVYLIAEGEIGTIILNDVNIVDGNIVDGSIVDGNIITPEQVEADLFRISWTEATIPKTIQFRASDKGEWIILAATLVNETDGTFQTIVPSNYRQIHSGDVKIYENLDVMPRAFMVHDWEWLPDVTAVIDAMQSEPFDVRETAVLIGEPFAEEMPDPMSEAIVTITQYEPEQVTIHTESDDDGLLILSDAYYPGWETAVDGKIAPLYQADGLFRGVIVPAGEHEVTFEFSGNSYKIGRTISLIGLLVWLMLLTTLYGLGRVRSMRL